MATLSNPPDGAVVADAAYTAELTKVKHTPSSEQGARYDALLMVESAGAFTVSVEERADEGGEWITIVDPALPFTGTAQGSLPIILYGDTEVRVLNSSGASANIWLR